MTELVAETIESVVENNFLVTVAPDLTIREGRNRHPRVWLVDYNSGEDLSEEDEENMGFGGSTGWSKENRSEMDL